MKKLKEKITNPTLTETAKLFQVARETISNWVREGYLELDSQNHVTLKSVDYFRNHYAGKVKLHARANKLQKEGNDIAEVSNTIQKELKRKKFDPSIGDRYEKMLSESYKNKEGICYTPLRIVEDMLDGVEIGPSQLFLDPCCGTGNFLVKALERGVKPQHLYGFDTDPNAIMIAQRRIKELTGHEAPHVVCADFLQESPKLNLKFDLVFTNPPWGKKLPKPERTRLAKQYRTGHSTDTSSLFLFAILSVLKRGGKAGMLMPESFFNIAVYENARKAVLKRTLLKVYDYGKPFGNMYSACAIWVWNRISNGTNEVACFDGNNWSHRPQKSFKAMPKHILNYWTSEKEMAFIEQLLNQPYLTLKGHAQWALGIVTGNNTELCSPEWKPGYQPVYRGSDILPDGLKEASLFINPRDFPRYQQMAPLKILNAPVKLIYRFISSYLVFYCDTEQRYILNSANMLVLVNNFPLSAEELVEIMNSPLTNWLFQQLFHTHKVLRSDLEMLPLLTDLSLHRGFNLVDLDR